MTLCILGAGAFGSALAISLAQNPAPLIVWSRANVLDINLAKNRAKTQYLTDENLPKNIKMTSDLELALREASGVIICIPAQKIYQFLYNNCSIIPNIPIVLCSKGIDDKTMLLPSQIVRKFLPQNQIAVLTGPSFAKEIATGKPTALTLACKNEKTLQYLIKFLSTPSLRLYSNRDIIGAQIAGSLKNVVAIGCGMVHGSGLGESARTAFMTRGLSEIINLGIVMGGKLSTFYGLSGLGDLALTCNSSQSRNFTLGVNYSKGKKVASSETIEGIKTASAANKLAKKLNVEVPIINTVDLILKEKISLESSIKALLARPLKHEDN